MSFKEKFSEVKKQFKKKGFFQSVKDILIVSYHQPHDIAAGFAFGMMLSFFPSFGLGMILSLFFAWNRKWNLLSTYLGTMLMNPFTASFWYFLEYRIGKLIVGNRVGFVENMNHFDIFAVANQIYIGAFILAMFAGPLAYFLSYGVSAKYQELKKKDKIHLPELFDRKGHN